MLNKLFVILQYCLPKKLISRLVGTIAESEIVWLKNPLIRLFIDIFNVNMSEAEKPKAEDYKSFNDFFTRALSPMARPITQSDIISPVDGKISAYGEISLGGLLQAKNQHFSLISLLAGDVDQCETFLDGNFMTIYLSPSDYHRIHMPIDAKLISTTYVPGALFSVNQTTTDHVPGLFAHNERLICYFETQQGPMAMILVGAMIVAAIDTVWAGQITPPPKTVQQHQYANQSPIQLKKGDEMGRFKLGSTVMLLFPPKTVTFADHLASKNQLRMGQPLASFKKHAHTSDEN